MKRRGKVNLNAMYREMLAERDIRPLYDPKIHGLTARELAAQWKCSQWTANRICQRKAKDGEWEATCVRLVRPNGSGARAMAYRPVRRKGVKRD